MLSGVLSVRIPSAPPLILAETDGGPSQGPFFLSVSKGFGGGDRPPETAKTVKIGL